MVGLERFISDEALEYHPSIVKFTQLLNDDTKMKHFSSSIRLFNRMCALGVPVDEYTMSIVINCCCHLYRSNDAFSVLGSCFKRNIIPNVPIFNTLLNGLVVEGRTREAERLFAKVITNKLCEPNVVMYNTMIKRHCKTHDYVAANDLLKLMDESGCKPDVFAYNTIIDSMCKHKMIDDAFKLLKQMVSQKGITPDVVTYTSLISGLCNVGRWEEASKLLKERLEDEKMSPNVQTFNILVNAFCKDGKIEEAEDAINLMLERGIVPNIVTHTSLLNGYCLHGKMTKARSLFDSMVSKGIMPNVVTYNTLIKGYCKKLKIDEAMHMFQEITKQGLEPDVVTYNTMLQGLFRVKRCEDANKCFVQMQAQGHAPNERTYAIMLKGLCDNNQLEDALSLFRWMSENKIANSNIVVYNILIDGAHKCGKLDIAKNLFDEITAKGLEPDLYTYTLMIQVLSEECLLIDAKQLFLKMKEKGCSPDDTTYNVLLHGCLKNQQYDDVKMLLVEMDERGYLLGASTLSLLQSQIAGKTLDATLHELMGKLIRHSFAAMNNTITALRLQNNQVVNASIGRQANQFSRLAKVEFPKVDVSEEYVVSLYLGDLPTELEMSVTMFKPKTLSDAYCPTNPQEATLEAVKKKNKHLMNHNVNRFGYGSSLGGVNKQPLLALPSTNKNWKTNPNTSLKTPVRKQLTQKKYEEKRGKNLCFYCDKKFVHGVDNVVTDALSRREGDSELFYLHTTSVTTDLEREISGGADALRKDMLHYFHDGAITRKICSFLYWKGLMKQVKHLVRECFVCQRYKPDLSSYPHPLPIPKLTKYAHFIPLAHQVSFLDRVCKLHVKLLPSIACHPQTHGQTKVVNRFLEAYLRCMTGENPKE
ncbi:putative tetratricopeptide-like helical domain superfamily protein [Tanacetum coccineum]